MATVALIFAVAAFAMSILCMMLLVTGRGAGGSPDGGLRVWASRMVDWGTRVADAVHNLDQSRRTALDGNDQALQFPDDLPQKRLGGPGDGSGGPPPAPGL